VIQADDEEGHGRLGRLRESAGELSGNEPGSTSAVRGARGYSVAMHVPARLAVALLLALAALPVATARQSCPRGGAESLAVTAEHALARGDWPEAARRYACAAAASPDAAIAERATRIAWDNQQLVRAVQAARRWLELAPANEVARRYLATGLLRLYDEDAAAEQFAELLDTSYADRARGYLVLLGILSAEDNETGAARVMDRLAAGDAALPEAQFAAGMLWQRAEHAARAIAALDRALALRSDWPQAEYARVRALAAQGRRGEALEASARLADAGDPLIRLSHAWQLLTADRREEAIALFEDLRRAGGTVASEAALALASVALDENRLDDTERFMLDADRDPEQTQNVRWLRARLAEERGDEVRAALLYQTIDSGPRAIASQLRSFRLLREQGSAELAEMLLDDFQGESPADTADIVSGVAAILVDEGREDEAIALLDRALGLLPDDGLILARGFLLERIDRVPEAVADMREMAKRRPNDPMTLNALGYTLVDRTKSVAEGTNLIERAIAAKPDSYAIQDSMGWALVQAGRLEEGKGWLERAWDLSEDPEVAAHLGETLWRMGRPEDARRLWDEALADNPDSPPLKRALERRAP
jgi:tetratricopeptide (TPR) repeat protein